MVSFGGKRPWQNARVTLITWLPLFDNTRTKWTSSDQGRIGWKKVTLSESTMCIRRWKLDRAYLLNVMAEIWPVGYSREHPSAHARHPVMWKRIDRWTPFWQATLTINHKGKRPLAMRRETCYNRYMEGCNRHFYPSCAINFHWSWCICSTHDRHALDVYRKENSVVLGAEGPPVFIFKNIYLHGRNLKWESI